MTSSGAAYASDPHLVDNNGSAVSIIRDKPKSVSFIRGFVRSTEGDGNAEGVSKMSAGKVSECPPRVNGEAELLTLEFNIPMDNGYMFAHSRM
jgi:hypothetical protein